MMIKLFYDMQLVIVIFVNFLISKVKRKNDRKKVEEKKVLVTGFHITFATDHCINENTQKILDFFTSLSLAKAYYSLFQLDHCGCWCYYCHLKHMVLRTIIN